MQQKGLPKSLSLRKVQPGFSSCRKRELLPAGMWMHRATVFDRFPGVQDIVTGTGAARCSRPLNIPVTTGSKGLQNLSAAVLFRQGLTGFLASTSA